ncbi:metabotropic glutamate receptor 8-like [Amphiura filiformis]|uniref:metabotropic glutamate receptor 8-like n=1 Tax=Amphiura filiformis TaxID=82378 RepID=UPI003B20D431
MDKIHLIMWLQLLITSALQIRTTQSVNTNFAPNVCEIHQKDGDYIIGGIFKPYVSSDTCDGVISSESVSFIESMTYAIESINNQSDLLSGVDLGYEIRNSCENEDITLWTMMTMTTSVGRYEYTETCPDQNRTNSGKVIGIVGTGRSASSIIAAVAGRVVTVPIISYFATSDELSDSERFPFFFRTVPADRFQAQVIVDILQHFNWKYIALFYSLDSYGISGARQIVWLAELYDICIPINVPVSIPASERDIEDIAKRLSDHDNVKVIVSFAVSRGALAVLKAVQKLETSRNFTFIGSDALSPVFIAFRDFASVLMGGIFIRFRSELPDTFQEHYRKLPNNQQQTSQWYQEKLRQIRLAENCTSWPSCSVLKVHWNTQQVISAVYAIAYALNASLQENLRQTAGSSERPIDGWLLKKKLLEVSVPSAGNTSFRLDENGDVPGTYQINNWQIINESYELINVGKWDSLRDTHLHLEDNKIQWRTRDGQVPISLCIEKCQPGYIQDPLEKICCSGCQKCPEYAIVVNENNASVCQDCPVTDWPDDDFKACVPIQPSFLGYRNPVFILSIAGVFLGLIFTALAAAGLCYYSEHSLIKASSRELCAINLIGLGFFCIVVALNLLTPTNVTCVAIDVCISTSFCISFAPVLLKVNRIWRIFNLNPSKKVRLKSPKSQVIMASCIILIEVLVAILSIFVDPSIPDILIPPQRKPYLEIYCRFGYGIFITWPYNSAIIGACCYYAFKARKLPDNFNESKFIAVSVYSTLIVCLAAIPVYTTAIGVAQKIGALSVPLLVNTYLSLFCLYLPKIYAIHYQREDIQSTRGTGSASVEMSTSSQRVG